MDIFIIGRKTGKASYAGSPQFCNIYCNKFQSVEESDSIATPIISNLSAQLLQFKKVTVRKFQKKAASVRHHEHFHPARRYSNLMQSLHPEQRRLPAHTHKVLHLLLDRSTLLVLVLLVVASWGLHSRLLIEDRPSQFRSISLSTVSSFVFLFISEMKRTERWPIIVHIYERNFGEKLGTIWLSSWVN